MDKFLVKSIFATLVILAAFAGVYFVVGNRLGGTRDFDVRVTAPQRIAAGDTVLYTVAYENNTKHELHDINFIITYPRGAMILKDESRDFEEISSHTTRRERIGVGERGEVAFETRIFGALNDAKDATLLVEYRKENSNAVVRIEKEIKIEITSLPLALKFTFPSKVSLGEEFEFTLTYLSTSPNAFPSLELALIYPVDTFQFLAADPPPSKENSLWDIGVLSPQDFREIKIRGVMTGGPGQEQVFRAEVANKEGETRISYIVQERKVIPSLPGFFLAQSLSGARANVVTQGERYEWGIRYQNRSSEILEHLEIFVFFEGEALDFSSLEPEGGTVLLSQKALRWDEGAREQLTLLKPGEEGYLSFAVSLKNTLPIKRLDDKNFVIRTRVVARMRGVTLAEDTQEFKIASRLSLYQRGFWEAGPFENFGPLPPHVGEKTVYTISWQVSNSSNELSHVVVRGAIPSFATWEGRVVPADEDITFNAANGEIIWNIGNLKNAVGIVLPIRQVVFQIGLTPRENDRRKTLELIGGANAVARDIFTGLEVESFAPAVDTRLPDEPGLSGNDGIVR